MRAESGKPGQKSTSTVLVELACDMYRFGISSGGETYALPKSGPKVVSMLRGAKSSLRAQLARLYFQKSGKAAPQQSLADALLVVEGMAQQAEEQDLYLRVARHNEAVYLDLGDQTGRAVKITGNGWDVVGTPPVLFKRTALNAPLPEPCRGGILDELWKFLNVKKGDRPLLASFLVSALIPDIPHPVPGLFGEQGTAKTTAQKILVSCIDPSPVPTRKPPRDAEAWVTAAAGSWMVGLDNLSGISDWLSDSICRAVTGDGDVRRKLYTDGEHHVFAFRRVIILNGIDLGSLRGDLGERLLPIHLEVIPESERISENELWPEWEKARPRVLGAILDLAAGVAGMTSSVRLASKPRMADFANILVAVDRILGTSGLSYYLNKQLSLACDSLTGDPFIMALMDTVALKFSGSSAKLLDMLTPEKPPRGWPPSARAVTQLLNRNAPLLRKSGWQVSNDGGHNHEKALTWTLVRPEMECEVPPQYPQARERAETCGCAGVAEQRDLSSQALAYLAARDGEV